MTAVTSATPMTLSPTSPISLPMIASNMPASVMMPKYSTEKTNSAAVGLVLLKPDLIIVARLSKL